MSTAQPDHEWFMRLAMQEAGMCAAAGGSPYGAIVVHNGVVIGRSGARKDSSKDPTGHAEMIAIRQAADYLGTKDMTGCTMYTNRGSCVMCSATVVSNNLSLVVRGVEPTESDHELLITLLDRADHTQVISGVLFEETARHFQSFPNAMGESTVGRA